MKHELITLKEYNALPTDMQITIQNSKSILRVKYVDPDFPTLHIEEKGNWIDLKCIEDYTLKAGESAFINLGVAMKPPIGYEAHLAPRSGTFRKYGLLQTNGVGVIDDSYSGNDDIWMMPVYATQDTVIKKGERLCQFRLFPTMETMFSGNSTFMPFNHCMLTIVEVEKLDDTNRGGFGSSGR